MRTRISTAFLVLFLSLTPALANDSLTEGEVFVGLIYKVALFTRWPEKAFGPAASKFSVCVLGEGPLTQDMELIESQVLQHRPVAVHRLKRLPAENDVCHVLFVDESESQSIGLMRKVLGDRPLLTFSAINDFGKFGGAVTFIRTNGRVAFAINANALERTGLTVDAQLLRLASASAG
jgi:hypothetical protein